MTAESLIWAEYDRLGDRVETLQRELREVRRQRAELWSAGHALSVLGIKATAEADGVRVSVEGRVVKVEPEAT